MGLDLKTRQNHTLFMNKKKSSGLRTISDILARAKTAPAPVPEVNQIWKVWDAAVGPAVAQNAQPRVIKNRMLLVAVSSGPWAQELEFKKDRIIKAVNRMAGADLVEDIRFKVGLNMNSAQPKK